MTKYQHTKVIKTHTSANSISYIKNAQKFNEDCVAFDIDLQDLEHNIPQSAWEMVAPNIAHDDRTTNATGFHTLQNQEVREDTTHEERHDNTRNTTDTLCMLYAKAAKKQDMNLHNYFTHIRNLNTEQMPYSDVQ